MLADMDDDGQRLNQVKGQYSRVERQRDNFEHAKSQVEEELLTQQGQLEDLKARINAFVAKHRTSVVKVARSDRVENPTPTSTSLEEKSAFAEVLKDCVQVTLAYVNQ